MPIKNIIYIYIYIERSSEVIFVFLRVIRRADFLHICCFHPTGDRTFPLIFSTQYVVRLHSFMLVIDKSLSHTLGTRLFFVSKVVRGQHRLIFLFRCGSCNDIKYHELKHQRQYQLPYQIKVMWHCKFNPQKYTKKEWFGLYYYCFWQLVTISCCHIFIIPNLTCIKHVHKIKILT